MGVMVGTRVAPGNTRVFTCVVSRAMRGPRGRTDQKDIRLVVPVTVICGITGFPNRVIQARQVYQGNKGSKEMRLACTQMIN